MVSIKERGKGRVSHYMLCSWLILATLSLWLGGCATPPENLAMISQVVTALPQEVEGCSFIGEVDNDHVRYTIQGARDNLRLQTARLGANTVVETHLLVTPDVTILYPYSWFSSAPLSTVSSPSFYLSGRAYICGEGQGPKRQLQGTQRLFKNTPNPLVNTAKESTANSHNKQVDRAAASTSAIIEQGSEIEGK